MRNWDECVLLIPDTEAIKRVAEDSSLLAHFGVVIETSGVHWSTGVFLHSISLLYFRAFEKSGSFHPLHKGGIQNVWTLQGLKENTVCSMTKA